MMIDAFGRASYVKLWVWAMVVDAFGNDWGV